MNRIEEEDEDDNEGRFQKRFMEKGRRDALPSFE
jgi:hypothetical protein